MPTAKFPIVLPATLGYLQNNLRAADEIANAQTAALFSLEYVESFLAQVGIKGEALRRLKNALSDVYQGHEHSLFKPRRSSRPRRTIRQRTIQVHAGVLMHLRMDNGEDENTAAKAVETVLNKAGFQLSQGTHWQKATATTVINWRKGLTSETADRWAADLYRGLLKQLRPNRSLYLLVGDEKTFHAARKRAIKIAESVLKGSIAEASES